MTRDDIIRMAREAGFQVLLPQDHVDGTGGVYVVEDEIAGMLERFAALVAAAEPVKPITVPKTVPLPPITCGFVDVRFDGERWFCDKCGKRMSADFETSVKRGSSEKCYLELMQRKSEAVRTMSERNMK